MGKPKSKIPKPPPQSCHTCIHNAKTNRGCDPCRSCRDDATLQNPKPRYERRTE